MVRDVKSKGLAFSIMFSGFFSGSGGSLYFPFPGYDHQEYTTSLVIRSFVLEEAHEIHVSYTYVYDLV